MKTPYSDPPWIKDDSNDDIIVIRNSNGSAICALSRETKDRESGEQDLNAALMYLAPEMYRALVDLVQAVYASDGGIGSEKFDGAIEDAETLIELLADDGVTLDALRSET